MFKNYLNLLFLCGVSLNLALGSKLGKYSEIEKFLLENNAANENNVEKYFKKEEIHKPSDTLNSENTIKLEDIIGFQDDSFASGDNNTSTTDSPITNPTDSPTTDPTPTPAESCDKEKVGIKLNGVSKSNFNNQNHNSHKNKLQGALVKAVNDFCRNPDSKCPPGGDSLQNDQVRFSNENERSSDLYVDLCISRRTATLNFQGANSLFTKKFLEDTLKKKEVQDKIKEDYKPFAGIGQLPKKKSGLKGWQITLISVGGVVVITLIVGAIVYMRRKKSENRNLGSGSNIYNY